MPTTEDIEALVVEIALGCEHWLARQGFGTEDEPPIEDTDDAQGVLQMAGDRNH